jgi:hypothetical protein
LVLDCVGVCVFVLVGVGVALSVIDVVIVGDTVLVGVCDDVLVGVGV